MRQASDNIINIQDISIFKFKAHFAYFFLLIFL
jgi:hypothetical protein